MNIPLHRITASIIETDDWGVSIHPFRGVAFIDPETGHWCDLRTGCVVAQCLGDELIIRTSRPVRDTWHPGLATRLPFRVRHALQQAA